MSISNHSVFLVLSVSLLLLVNYVASTTFQFNKFTSAMDGKFLDFQGDTFAVNGVLQLTRDQHSVGRATYIKAVPLWNAKTGQVADFSTHFTFSIDGSSVLHGDGFAFFLVPSGSKIPANSSGGFLGLVNGKNAFNQTKNQFVAVEFDTFGNPEWEMSSPHVGIDIGTIVSAVSSSLDGNHMSGIEGKASVTYDSASMSLTANIEIIDSSRVVQRRKISTMVAFSEILPEHVSVGFSGSTGDLTETHGIRTWSFSSNL